MRKIIPLFLLIIIISEIFSEGLIFGSDQSESSFAEHNKRSTLIGNAYVITENLDISADKIELYGSDYRFANSTGNVVIHNTKENFIITSENLLYDNDKKEATVTGSATLKDVDNDMIIKGEYIKSFEETSVTLIQIRVRIINEDLVCRSEFAEFNSKTNKLILTGNPIVYKGEDLFEASIISIDLDNNNIIMEGKVQGKISQEESDDGSDTTKK